MKIKEITVTTTSACAELVADLLQEIGSEGAAIYDAAVVDQTLDDPRVVWDYCAEGLRPAQTTVKGFFPANAEIGGALAERLAFLRENCPFDCGTLAVAVSERDSEEWADIRKREYRPVSAGEITVCPAWTEVGERGGCRVLIDPGQAFGTGAHETTHMCLTLLQECARTNGLAADLGTGSGILAIAAAKYAHMRVDAYDIDATAVALARENIRLNDVTDLVCAAKRDVLTQPLPAGRYDLVLANITASPLIAVAGAIAVGLKKGGSAVLSGILDERAEEVLRAYAKNGMKLRRRESRGGWTAFRLEKERDDGN